MTIHKCPQCAEQYDETASFCSNCGIRFDSLSRCRECGELLADGKELPIDVKNGIIYYVGPTPAKPGRAIGSAGPTSSYRMDPYTEPLLKEGLKVMVGKGSRSKECKDLLVKYGAVYLSAIGGAAASISETVKECRVVTYEDLGAEAIHRLKVEDFYAIVTYDSVGNDLFEQGLEKYRKV